jgi:prenyl protein peptidase
MVPVLLASAIQEMRVIFLVPLFFGVAHAHHAMQRYKAGVPWKQILMGGIFQFAYTSLFGSYVAFVLLRTGSIVCAIVCHSYCNYMGLPGFYFLQRRGTAQIFVGMMYLAGMLLFARGFSLIDSTNSLSHTIMKSLV